MGSVAAGGLIETFSDVNEELDISDVLKRKNVFALIVNGDSMIEACIADGDMVLMEPILDSYSLRNGSIVRAMVPGLGTTLKYFFKRGDKILEQYEELTGILALINTSFNAHEEPIVCSIDDALKAFLNKRIDVLIINDYIITE